MNWIIHARVNRMTIGIPKDKVGLLIEVLDGPFKDTHFTVEVDKEVYEKKVMETTCQITLSQS